MSKRRMFKVIFHNQGRVYEVYARSVSQSGLYGFVEVDRLVFETRASLVLDPSEEQLKSEFGGVSRTYIPIHAIVRIDEVDKEGHGKVTQIGAEGATIMPFPLYTPKGTSKD